MNRMLLGETWSVRLLTVDCIAQALCSSRISPGLLPGDAAQGAAPAGSPASPVLGLVRARALAVSMPSAFVAIQNCVCIARVCVRVGHSPAWAQ
jgi:hypothetical protein